MMGTSVERERGVMGRNRNERGNVYHYKKVLKRYRRHWPERVGRVNGTFSFTGARYKAQLLKGRLVLKFRPVTRGGGGARGAFAPPHRPQRSPF